MIPDMFFLKLSMQLLSVTEVKNSGLFSCSQFLLVVEEENIDSQNHDSITAAQMHGNVPFELVIVVLFPIFLLLASPLLFVNTDQGQSCSLQ